MSKVRKISKRRWLFAGVVAAALAVGIVGFVLLPEALVTQLSFDGSPSSRMPKTVFLPLAFALIAVSAAMYAFPNAQRGRWLCIALILLAAELFAVIYNLVI